MTPKVRWRGIRQHVNFPMDISSYEIEEAKHYIASLVRMRFNEITFHSYPQQWYEARYDGRTDLAGSFFYGDVHYMYNSGFLKRVIPTNDSIFCIPGAEPLFHKAESKSKYAVRWMQELVDYAKDLGMYVQFSFEPRLIGVPQTKEVARQICQAYPRIDALEMITEETGGWGAGCTGDQVRQTLKKYFTPEIAANEEVTAQIADRQNDLDALYSQIGIISHAINELNKEGDIRPELKLGIYCTVYRFLPGAYRLTRLAVPDTRVCLMPSHGSDGTADAVTKALTSIEDLRMTELYSWIEFDGLMYLYQNSIKGNERLMEHIGKVLPNEQFGSLTSNHWRTAENRTSARYMAEASLRGCIPSAEFYRSYAGRLGVADWARYRQAMELVNQGDSYACIHLGNIGFCWMGAWRNGGSFTWMNKEHIQEARRLYFEAGEIISELLSGLDKKSAAHEYLALVGNRILCTVIYLDAFAEASNLQSVKALPDGTYSASEQERAREICNRALLKFDMYMEVLARLMPDRGCQGTLVSLWNSPIRGLKIYRSRMGGVGLDELPYKDQAVDAPPLPILMAH